MNVLAAAIVALTTGFGVYRSCIHHQKILVFALAIDAFSAAVEIGAFRLLGFLQ